eukprot:3340516-Alexandrium_andersonii.AAC.1
MAFRRQSAPTAAFFSQCRCQRPMAGVRCAAARGTVAMRSARSSLSAGRALPITSRFVAEILFVAVPCAIA